MAKRKRCDCEEDFTSDTALSSVITETPPPSPSPFHQDYITYRSVHAFKRLKFIGQGGFGTVYLAENSATGEVVAIKHIYVTPDTFLPVVPEIEYLFDCRGHPNIVEIKELALDFTKNDQAYIVMEFAKDDIKTLLCDRPFLFDEDIVRLVMRQLLRAIADLHKRGILHRDIKTANILVDGRGTVKLCDFGLAANIMPGEATLPLTTSRNGRHPFGTRCYCAPELLDEDTTEYTQKIDVWSAGCVMAEMLWGAPIFGGRDLDELLDEIFDLVGVRQISVDRLRERIPESKLSSNGYDLLKKMLQPSSQDRITAEEALWHPWFSWYKIDQLKQPRNT